MRHTYKAKQTYGKHWCHGYLVKYGVENQIIDFSGVSNIVNGHTVCQCTGLKDKKDELIFEGDEVKEGKREYIIKWHDNGWSLFRECNKMYYTFYNGLDLELTGRNIHDELNNQII